MYVYKYIYIYIYPHCSVLLVIPCYTMPDRTTGYNYMTADCTGIWTSTPNLPANIVPTNIA